MLLLNGLYNPRVNLKYGSDPPYMHEFETCMKILEFMKGSQLKCFHIFSLGLK